MSAKRVLGVALGILLVGSLVLVRQSPDTQFDACDTIYATVGGDLV